jgi:hypothetical protein
MTAPSPIAAAKAAVAVETLAGAVTKLRRAGSEQRGQCPLCGAGAKSATPPFAVNPAKQSWRCYGCDRFGDVVDLERELNGGSPVEAAKRLLGGSYQAAPRPAFAAKPKAEGPTNAEKNAREMWAAGKPVVGSLAERYLLHRGVDAEVVARVGDNLRFHPFAKWDWDDSKRDWIKAPAMLARVVTSSGPTGGVHATYLARDGRGKAALSPAKRMWGPQHDAEDRPGGAWLIDPETHADLLVAEGIETALSAATLLWRRGEAWAVAAALSLNRLQGGIMRDAEGCADLIDPRGDPERPAFTWPGPLGAPWRTVAIAIDRDMSPVRVKGRTGRGKACDFTLDGEARARLGGRLAVAAWKPLAGQVRAIAPPPGRDFNDELKARAG